MGLNDAMAMMPWVRNFLIAQGHEVTDNVIFQDNKSAILFEENGRCSSGKKTGHIEILCCFIADDIQRCTAHVECCPTDEMVADFFAKPLQDGCF